MTESEDDEQRAPDETSRETARPAGEENVVEITEEFAGRALARLKSQATLPEVAVDPRQVAATLRKAQSRVLWLSIFLFAASTTVGLLVITGAALEDWYMHVGMYIVIFSFFAIYLKAHLAKQRVMRHFYAGLTVFMKLFFAGILHDLVEAKEVLDGTETVVRAALPWLDVASGFLVLSAVALTLHWVALRGRPDIASVDLP